MTVRTVVMTVLFLALFLSATGSVFAEENKFELNPSYGIREILNAYAGKRVAIRTGAGDALEGTVVKVGTHLVHISQLSGKDFYDAVVPIDRIDAVIVKVRGK